MKHLDPRFAKVMALMSSTQHHGERTAARSRAEAIAKSCGMTFDEAKAHLSQAASAPPNIFAGFDDWMEAREPGWKAQQTKERDERRRRNFEKRAAVIAKYGSEDAALEPCERERLILAAVKPWRVAQPPPHQRWTNNLGGWAGYGFDRGSMPPHILEAILTAYPLPKIFAEAKAEHEYWRLRDDELGLVLDESGLGLGDTGLDYAAGVRAEAVRDLALKDLPVTSIVDLYERTKMYRDLESTCERVEDALFRDLEAMALARHPSHPSTSNSLPGNPAVTSSDHLSVSVQLDDLGCVLRADPSRSDRSIGRLVGCSPTTVGKLRRQLGLKRDVRSVQRRGQIYEMHFGMEATR